MGLSQRNIIAAVFLLVVFGAWFAWFRPAALGGPAQYVIVSGVSMEPTYHDGDLVILREQDGYAPGDIVSYPTEDYFQSGRIVIHRIAGEDEAGYITRGDNLPEVDDWRPTADQIQGKAWFSIPGVGTYLSRLQESNLAIFLVSVLLIGGVGGTKAHQRRRRNGMRLKQRIGGTDGKQLSDLAPNLPFASLAVAGVSVALFGLLAVLAFRTAAESTETRESVAYTQTGTFEYVIEMEPSTVYPEGVLRSPGEGTADGAARPNAEPLPPAPAFTALTRAAEVVFHYELEGTGSAEVTGVLRADLVLSADTGWSTRSELLAPVAFEGATVSRALTVDLAGMAAVFEQIEAETGSEARNYTITVEPHVEVAGMDGFEVVDAAFTSTFTLAYTERLITPPGDLSTSIPTPRTESLSAPQALSLGGWSMDVAFARRVALAGLAVSAVAFVVLAALAGLRLWNNEHARVQARYGSRVMTVQTRESERDHDCIRVAAMADLVRLAGRVNGFVLHEVNARGHRYFVRDGEDTYEYLIEHSHGGGAASELIDTR